MEAYFSIRSTHFILATEIPVLFPFTVLHIISVATRFINVVTQI
jgi:hypothetical protein